MPHSHVVLPVLLAAALAFVPSWLGEHFFVLFLTNVFIFCILTTGLQLLVGASGILSLGHAAFFGVGAYGTALLTSQMSVPFPLALIAGVALAALTGLIMSPIIRLREIYFAMASFAFGIIVYQVFIQWKSLTGGHDGLIMIPFAELGPITLGTNASFYYFALVLVTLQLILFGIIQRAPLGRALNAIRQSEAGARSVGINITAVKICVIVISAACAGLAGGLYGHLYGSLSPTTFSWHQSVALLTMVVIGGGRGVWGVVLATFVLLYLPNQLRVVAEYSEFINGLLLTLFMVLMPSGLSGLGRAMSSAFAPLLSRRRVASEGAAQ